MKVKLLMLILILLSGCSHSDSDVNLDEQEKFKSSTLVVLSSKNGVIPKKLCEIPSQPK